MADGPRRALINAVGFVVAILFYIVAAKPVGFMITMTLINVGLMLMLQVKWWKALVIGVLALILWALFEAAPGATAQRFSWTSSEPGSINDRELWRCDRARGGPVHHHEVVLLADLRPDHGRAAGMTATLGAALLIPFTFFMDPVPAIASIISMAAMAIFAGDIPGALLRMPGTPSSAAYTADAYELTKMGKGGLALGVAGGLGDRRALRVVGPDLPSRRSWVSSR